VMSSQVNEGIQITDFVIQALAICGIGPDALDYRVLLHCI
jgi:hypothetical protein